MRLFLDWITSINLSAASYNNNASLFLFHSFLHLAIVFILSMPIPRAQAQASRWCLLVVSAIDYVSSLSLFLYLSFYLFFSPCLSVFGRFGHRAANLNEEKQRVVIWSSGFSLSVTRFFFLPSFPFSLAVMLISAKTPAQQQQRQQHERRKVDMPSCVTLTTMTHRMRTDPLDLCHRYFPGLPS
jgi:hypothetical protein